MCVCISVLVYYLCMQRKHRQTGVRVQWCACVFFVCATQAQADRCVCVCISVLLYRCVQRKRSVYEREQSKQCVFTYVQALVCATQAQRVYQCMLV